HEIRLSRGFSGQRDADLLVEAFQNKVPVDGKVKEECKGGFRIELMGKKAFCPISQIDIKYVEKAAEYIGETFPFLITEYGENGKNIVVSRRDLLKKELEEKKKGFLAGLSAGMEIQGTVTKLMPFGAFVELMPGLEGMVHLSEMSWGRTEKAEDIFSVGDPVTVKILEIQQGKGGKDLKISLSLKQMTGDPWADALEKYHVGDRIKGKVTRCVKFGVFIEIVPGLEGLVHISQMSYTKRVLRPEDEVEPGEIVDVVINEIDPEKKRISLSIKDVDGDPWTDIQERYKPGQTVKGTLEKKERFGYFVTLEPGVTGLLPSSAIAKASKPSDIERLNEGDDVMVLVTSVDPRERKISLSPTDLTEVENWKQYADTSKKSMGSLGEKLQQALKKK
ncbi:MAG: S1 RNA-binding domain-containing protein, partial [Deltaproteobacteria bacterium]|nr:S1 RNA-binding domain-containing protein [Deltaproteobacteria bacterium]